MGHAALQRVVVRMLFDAAFADQVYANPAAALDGLALSEAERGWLIAPDRRAYRVDPMRRHRSLRALIEEHPVSVAALAAGGAPVRGHDAFFSGERFHRAIEERRSLATAFGERLAALAQTPLQRGLVALERGMAAARRGRAAAFGPGVEVRLAGTARIVACPSGTLEAYARISQALGEGGRAPLEALLGGNLRLPRTPVDPAGVEHVLIEAASDRGDAGASLSFQSEELAGLLRVAADGATRAALIGYLGEAGLDGAEAVELVDELVTDGLLDVLGALDEPISPGEHADLGTTRP